MDLIKEAARIVAEYVKNNPVPVSELPTLINNTYQALAKADKGLDAVEPEKPVPAVPIRKSVAASHVVCLDCGKKLKMLKRHLTVDHDLTPDEYRARWGLPADHPLVAPDYAEQRSALAHRIGLGTTRRRAGGAETADAPAAPAAAPTPAPVAAPVPAAPEPDVDVPPVSEDGATLGFRYPANRWSKPSDN